MRKNPALSYLKTGVGQKGHGEQIHSIDWIATLSKSVKISCYLKAATQAHTLLVVKYPCHTKLFGRLRCRPVSNFSATSVGNTNGMPPIEWQFYETSTVKIVLLHRSWHPFGLASSRWLTVRFLKYRLYSGSWHHDDWWLTSAKIIISLSKYFASQRHGRKCMFHFLNRKLIQSSAKMNACKWFKEINAPTMYLYMRLLKSLATKWIAARPCK